MTGKHWTVSEGATTEPGKVCHVYTPHEHRPTGSLEHAIELEGMTAHRAVRFLVSCYDEVKTIDGSKKIFAYRSNGEVK